MYRRTLQVCSLALLCSILPGCNFDWLRDLFGYKEGQTQQENRSQNNNNDKNSGNHNQAASDKEKKEAAIVVAEDGKTAVGLDEFQQTFDALMQSQPGIEQILPLMEESQQKQLYREVANMLANQYAITQYVKDNNLDKTEEYEKNRKILLDQVEKQLNSQAFNDYISQQIESVSDEDARQYYREHKHESAFQQEPFIKEAGGIKALVVQAENEEQAQDIAEQAQQNKDLHKAARDYNLSVGEPQVFRENMQEPHKDVVEKIVNASELPTVDIAYTDNGPYVFRAIERVKPTYADFEDVKDEVKNYMQNERLNEYYSKKLTEVKREYGISVNEEAIEQHLVSKPPQQQQPQEDNQAE